MCPWHCSRRSRTTARTSPSIDAARSWARMWRCNCVRPRSPYTTPRPSNLQGSSALRGEATRRWEDGHRSTFVQEALRLLDDAQDRRDQPGDECRQDGLPQPRQHSHSGNREGDTAAALPDQYQCQDPSRRVTSEGASPHGKFVSCGEDSPVSELSGQGNEPQCAHRSPTEQVRTGAGHHQRHAASTCQVLQQPPA